jgi:hypothetical protein
MPLLPLRYAPAAQLLRETLERYQSGAGDRFDLRPVIERARQVEVAAREVDDLLDQLRRRAGAEERAVSINRGLREMDRWLVRLNFSAVDAFEQDLAVPIPPVPLLEAVTRLSKMDPAASETRYLFTEMVRNRNRVMFQLRETLEAGSRITASIREAFTS